MQQNVDLYFEIFDTGNFIGFEPLTLNFSNAENEWDRNWVQTKVTIKGDTFSGEYIADFMTVDFEMLKREVKLLDDDFNGSVTFQPLEQGLSLNIKGDGLGHFEVGCTAKPPNTSEILSFSMNFDQTSLSGLINQLDKITKAFPIDGNFRIKNE